MTFPDFMIAGAMKAGTSSLHYLLGTHPDIFIPKNELFLFDIDDIEQHPDFFALVDGKWAFHDFDAHYERYLSWYASAFEAAGEGQILGEHSTTYLASRLAPARISKAIPGVKILISLRDPASRTYSQYWHEVRTGWATRRFEDALQSSPGTMLQRSFYGQQIRAYLDSFPRDRIKFVLFEELIEDLPRVLAEICDFLGVSNDVDLSGQTRYNATHAPRSLRVWLLRNRIFRKREFLRYARGLGLPGFPESPISAAGLSERAMDRIFEPFAPAEGCKIPPMQPSTRHFLNDLFRSEQVGLGEWIGKDLDRYWYQE